MCCQVIVDRVNNSVTVKRGTISIDKVVTLTGHDHIVAPRQSTHHTHSIAPGKQRCQATTRIGLRFFAAKATTHSTRFNHHLAYRHSHNFSDQFLCFGWMLVGTFNDEPAVFIEPRHCHLALKIEMLLSANNYLSTNLL